MAGVNMTHVPYRGGGPALSDLLAGVVDLSFLPMPASIEHIKSGRLRALGVTTAKRVAALPDLPPIGDFVRGYEGDGWQGVSGPRAPLLPSLIDSIGRSTQASQIRKFVLVSKSLVPT
jgi:tripartite-type tricarboxylate transporter receptor subunit TctC